ncbi:beta-lactamase/transpeptidase-like protein [Paraphoma chrysanthemicola]|nr:beta-lactamase/transpeptidase-like protein [Paraphoma chrysanthemicola]
MDGYESYIKSATLKGAQGIPSALTAVVNKDGHYVYKHTAGYGGVASDAKPLHFDTTFNIASCTKLITSIAILQLVERGIIGLDDPINTILPEFASQPIVEQNLDGSFKLQKSTGSITLRHLMTHTSGSTYDWMDAKLAAWRASRGETPKILMDGDIAAGYAYPRSFDTGEGWGYGGGLDWAGLLVSRLSKKGLEEYVDENIARPLNITSFTWHLPQKPAVADKCVTLAVRQDDGSLVEDKSADFPDPVSEGGGLGMYANVHDYMRVLADLLKEIPTLLRKDTVDLMFSPQLKEGTRAFSAFTSEGGPTYQPVYGNSLKGVKANHSLAGMILMADVTRQDYFKPKGTLSWTGLPNLFWNINRERGLALMFATQLLPYGDSKCVDAVARFETAVWRNLKP